VFGDFDLDPVNWLGLAMLLAVGGAVAWLGGVVMIVLTLTRPPRRTTAWAIARGFASDPGEMDLARYGLGPTAFSSSTLTHARGRCAVWELPGANPNGPVAVLTHGWGDGKINALSRLEPFVPICSRVIVWDLPGHGESGGACRLGLDEHEALGELLRPISEPVILLGWSLGAGVSLLAARERVGKGLSVVGVICEAPYRLPQTPAQRVLAARGVPNLGMLAVAQWLIGGVAWRRAGEGFDRAEQARKLTALGVPVRVLHGELDPVSPVQDGRDIAQAAGAEAAVLAQGRHNDLWVTPPLRASSLAQVRSWLAGWLEEKLTPGIAVGPVAGPGVGPGRL